mgnify:FL=1
MVQYFTFLGLGSKPEGYKEVIYTFQDDPDHATISEFIQLPIIKKFADQLSEVIVFCTDESYEKYHEALTKKTENLAGLSFIKIKHTIDFDAFVKELLSHMRENEEVILDITHSFRNIPMKLLFALKYIEMTKKVKIRHLYYGKLVESKEEGIIEDFIHDYDMQKISDILTQFDRTLVLREENLGEILEEPDSKMETFLKSLSNLYEMIEFCQFDRCIEIVNSIVKKCTDIEKSSEDYIIILPIIKRIKEKFSEFKEASNNVTKKIILINLLLQHGRYQAAITFCDQFFREELIRATLSPNNKNFNLKDYLNKRHMGIQYNNVYKLSNYLIFSVYKLRGIERKEEGRVSWDALLNDVSENIISVTETCAKYKQSINTFYDDRNHVNHGSSMKSNSEMIENIHEILKCISVL